MAAASGVGCRSAAVLVLRCLRAAEAASGSAAWDEVRDLLVMNGMGAREAEAAIAEAVAQGLVRAAAA